MKRAIITGASSGIGYSLAHELSKRGYELGLTARRETVLRRLSESLPGKSFIEPMDLTDTASAITRLRSLIRKLNGLDIIILNAATGNHNPEYTWEKERDTLDVNVIGFTALANEAFGYFSARNHGHIVGISSVAAHFGYGNATAYNASKAFASNYLEGLAHKALLNKKNILITDIKPGFVNTPMTQGNQTFWAVSADRAAFLIANAIESGKRRAYIPRRWFYVSLLIRMMPDLLLQRILR